MHIIRIYSNTSFWKKELKEERSLKINFKSKIIVGTLDVEAPPKRIDMMCDTYFSFINLIILNVSNF